MFEIFQDVTANVWFFFHKLYDFALAIPWPCESFRLVLIVSKTGLKLDQTHSIFYLDCDTSAYILKLIIL